MLAPTPCIRIGRAIHCLLVAVPSCTPWQITVTKSRRNVSPTCPNCCQFYDWFVLKSHIFIPLHKYSHYLLSTASDRKHGPWPASLVHYPLLGLGQKPHALEAPCLPRLHRIWSNPYMKTNQWRLVKSPMGTYHGGFPMCSR